MISHTKVRPVVSAGSTVSFIKNNKERETWTIVARGESDISNGKIAVDAPIAKLLLGCEVGDTVTGMVAQNPVILLIKSISDNHTAI